MNAYEQVGLAIVIVGSVITGIGLGILLSVKYTKRDHKTIDIHILRERLLQESDNEEEK